MRGTGRGNRGRPRDGFVEGGDGAAGDRLFQKKSLGQVFLKTDWPVLRMVEKLQELRVERVLEIGPGNGILTRVLVAAGLKVTAVEKDDRFAERMRDYATTLPPDEAGSLSVVNADILRFDLAAWIKEGGGRTAIIGNIPYNISSPILLTALEVVDQLVALLFMTQLEFARRVVSGPDSKDYGSLSVFAQLRANATLEFKVERGCFQPIPKVDSAVLLLTPKRDRLDDARLTQAEKVTRAAFTQRRKKLRNSVRQFLGDKSEADCPIDLERRADTLSPQEFVTLTDWLLSRR